MIENTQKIKKLLRFEGRSSRSLLLWNLYGIDISLLTYYFIFSAFSFFVNVSVMNFLELIVIMPIIIFILAIFKSYLLFFSTVKRLHDLGRSGKHYFLLYIPVYNIYILYLLFFKKGMDKKNKYGETTYVKARKTINKRIKRIITVIAFFNITIVFMIFLFLFNNSNKFFIKYSQQMISKIEVKEIESYIKKSSKFNKASKERYIKFIHENEEFFTEKYENTKNKVNHRTGEKIPERIIFEEEEDEMMIRYNKTSQVYTLLKVTDEEEFELLNINYKNMIKTKDWIKAFFTSIKDFFGGKDWYSLSDIFGFLPLLIGSIWVTIIALLISIPLSLVTSIYIAEFASKRMREVLKSIVETMAAIPSVVLGFLGLFVIAGPVKEIFNLPTGLTALTGGVILAFMSMPTMISIADDSLRSLNPDYKQASLALGASKLQTIFRVLLPAAFPGIFAGIMLGFGRIIGETMTVLMVTGNSPNFNVGPLSPVRTMTATIAAEMGEVVVGETHYYSLFVIGLVLFIISFITNSLADYYIERARKNMKGA